MIDPKSLRIGNLVYEEGEKLTEIINGWQLDEGMELFPIPLTCEWLEKLWFEKMTIGWWVKNPVSLYYHEGGYLYSDLPSLKTKFKYVHELQNLYSVLSGGQELEAKP